jgi:hypothetical protein
MAVKKLGSDLENPEFVAGIEEDLEKDLRGKPKRNTSRISVSEPEDEDEEDVGAETDEGDEESDEDVDTDDTEESETEEAEDESSEKPQPKVKETRKLSPEQAKAEAKLVSLKKQLDARDNELRELRKERETASTKARELALSEQFGSEGYDKDTAQHMARTAIGQESLALKATMLEFRLDHAELLREYPDASRDIPAILERMEKSGMTADQVVRGIYGGTEPERDKRARLAASGQTVRTRTDDAASRGGRYAEPETGESINRSDRAAKAQIEAIVGRKVSDERFRELKKKYGF